MARLSLIVSLLALAACTPPIDKVGVYPSRDICQLAEESTDIVLADVLSWGKAQTRRFEGKRYRVTPVQLKVRTAFKGGHFGEQTVWFLGEVSESGKSAYGPLRLVAGRPVTGMFFMKDTDPELFLIGGGYLWRFAPGYLKNAARFSEGQGVKEKDLRFELEELFAHRRSCERAPGPGVLGH